MARLADTQLVILSAASQRDDRAVEPPANVKGEAARKVVDKLIRAGLLEKVRAGGSLPVWRRDDDSGAMALRITKTGLKAINIEDEATAAADELSVRHAPNPEAEKPAPKDPASRTWISVSAQKSARKQHRPGKAKTQNSLDAPKPAGFETSSGACDARPTRGRDDYSHHARNPLAAAFGPRLFRSCGTQKARSRSQFREGRWRSDLPYRR